MNCLRARSPRLPSDGARLRARSAECLRLRTVTLAAALCLAIGSDGPAQDDAPAVVLDIEEEPAAVETVAITATVVADGPVAITSLDAAAPTANAAQRPFVLPTQSTDVSDAMDDYRRYCQRGTWEKAFKSLEKVNAAGGKGLVPAKDGILVPVQVLLQQSLADLPADGQAAYRLFHDAEAKALLAAAQGPGEVEKLTQLATAHLVTSVGDVAAERLGDLYFEQGELGRAISAWQSVLHYRADSPLPKARLLVKTGIALARAGRWNDLAEIEREVRQRYADEAVELGGQPVPAGEHLAKLLASRPAAAAGQSETNFADDLPLAAAIEPAWQFRVSTKGLPDRRGNRVMLAGGGVMFMDMYGNQRPLDMVFPTVVDERRLYANFLGVLLAVDLNNGKLTWRTSKFQDLLGALKQNQYILAEQYAIALGGERLWIVARDVGQVGQHGQPFALKAHDKATGKELLNSRNVAELNQFNFMGTPVLAPEVVYATALKANSGTELYALALQASDGKLLWSTHLGTHQVDQNQMYYQRSCQPALLLERDRLYVDTHAGALIQLDAANGGVTWAVAYDSPPQQANNYGYSGEFITAGRPQMAGGQLFFKGMRSPRLVSVNPDLPAVVWNRPVASSANLVGLDDERVYLGGEEVTAYDRQTKKLLWSNRLPPSSTFATPVLTRNRLYQFTPRGIYELDKTTGRQVGLYRGADLESMGGRLVLAERLLIAVSNLSITAYPLAAASAAPAPVAGAAAPASTP